MRKFVLDIEANGLTPDKVWCIVVREIGHDDSLTWSGDRLKDFIPYRVRHTCTGKTTECRL